MQRVSWDEQLTTTIQHDAFAEVVAAIYAKSEQLSIFAAERLDLPPLDSEDSEPHLISRSLYRRQAYQRLELYESLQPLADAHYDSRDGWRSTIARNNVFESVSYFRNWSSSMSTEKNLVKILQHWSDIGGYNAPFDGVLLSDLLQIKLSDEFGALVVLCQKLGKEDMYKLMFLFGNISFRVDVDMNIVRVLIAFAVFEDLKVLVPPQWATYTKFRQHQVPRIDYLLQLIQPCLVPYGEDERSTLEFQLSAKNRRRLEMAQRSYEKEQHQHATILVEFLYKQWPCAEPSIEGFSAPISIDLSQALGQILPEWLRLYQNFELSNHVALVQGVLDKHATDDKIVPPRLEVPEQMVLSERYRGSEFPTLSQLFGKKGPERFPIKHTTNSGIPPNTSFDSGAPATLSKEARELLKIVKTFTASKSVVRQTYGNDLLQSLEALATVSNIPKDKEMMHPILLDKSLSLARQSTSQAFKQLQVAFEALDPRVRWLQGGGLWPSISTVTLLEYLRSSVSLSLFGDGMREALVAYALSITNLQRLNRVEEAIMKGSKAKALEEQGNIGHENWNPAERSDWLLLEIDANILIRPGQIDVALATIAPSSGGNSVLQMNCGQG